MNPLRRVGTALIGPAVFATLFGVGMLYAHLTPDKPVTTTRIATSCTVPYHGYTLRFQARLPLTDEGLGDESIARWSTRFSFTHPGGTDPLQLAARDGSSYEFSTDDPPQFAHLDGYSQPYGSWQRHDDTSEYARTNFDLDQPGIDAHFDVPGGKDCSIDLHSPKG